ncbi:MAG: ABC transporter substrate-binding protein [Chloroflexi bacterium]|nr:ABC transporter substrate-binding protein [Chloroflexota bacterium]
MKEKLLNIVIALALGLTVLLGACAREEPPTATPAPKPTPAPTTAAPVAQATPVPKATTAAPQAPPATKAAPPTKPPAAAGPPIKSETVVVLVDGLGSERFLPSNDTQLAFKYSPVYETLWSLDPDTRALQPVLAQTLPEYSADGKTVTINLRRGIQFHDGNGELTAEDVKFSIEMAGRDNSVNPGKADFARVKVEILDPYKLALQLPAPSWSWAIENGANYRLILPIVSKKYIEKVGEAEAGRKLIGTGPFRFVRHEIGKQIEFEAVPNHWRVTPEYKNLVYKVISEPSTVISMLRTGEADVAAIPLQFVPEARAAGLEVKMIPNVGVIGIGLGGQYLPAKQGFDPNVPWVLAKEPDKALKVRRALNLAVNRQEIIEKVLNGIGGQWPIIASPNNDASYDPAWKPYPYDPDQAKRLLAEAGFPNGFETTMVLFASTGHATREIGEAVATYWEKIGVRVKRLPMDQPAHRDRQIGRKNAGVAYPMYRNGVDEEMIGPASFFRSNSTGMNIQFEYPEIDELLTKGTTELNREKRMAIAYEFHKFIYDNYLAVPVSVENTPYVVSRRVGDYKPLTGDPSLMRLEYLKLK